MDTTGNSFTWIQAMLISSRFILGGGLPLFPNLDERAKLKLLDTKSYPSGVIRLHYGRG